MEKVDFLPERIRAQRRRRRWLIRQVCMIAAALAALVTLAYVRQGQIARAQADLNLLRDRAGNVERQLAVRDALEKQQAELLIKKRIDDQLGSRVNVLDVLSELGRVLPSTMNLATLSMETVEVRQQGAAPAPVRVPVPAASVQAARRADKPLKRVRLVITGLAPTDVDVANFIGQLSASPLFEDVNMGYAKNSDFRGYKAREFQVSCYVVN